MVICRVMIRVTPFRALITLLITYLLSPLPLQVYLSNHSEVSGSGFRGFQGDLLQTSSSDLCILRLWLRLSPHFHRRRAGAGIQEQAPGRTRKLQVTPSIPRYPCQ